MTMMANRMALFDNDAQHKLVPSVTEDDEDDALMHPSSHNDLIGQVRSSSSNKDRHAIAYLLRYETMVRQQEAEDMATLSHLRPCIERIRELAGLNKSEWSEARSSDLLQQHVSFGDLAKAFHKLQDSKEHDQPPEYMTTDRQLMMLLQVLTENMEDLDKSVSITWAEFVQAYKLCIAGMQTLQHLPLACDSGAVVRSRSRNRTLSILTLFEAGSTRLFDGTSLPVAADKESTSGSSNTATQPLPDIISPRRISAGGILKMLMTISLVVLSGMGASLYYGLLSESDMATFATTVTGMASESKAQAISFLAEKTDQFMTQSSETSLYKYFQNWQHNHASSEPACPQDSFLFKQQVVASHSSSQGFSVPESYKSTQAVAVAEDSPPTTNVAVPAVFGGIVGAAGAPYAGLLLQRLSSFLIASSTTQILLLSLVAAFLPMAVGGFFARMSTHVRNYELEFSIE